MDRGNGNVVSTWRSKYNYVSLESFGKDWINDVVNELKINPKIMQTMAISSTCFNRL